MQQVHRPQNRAHQERAGPRAPGLQSRALARLAGARWAHHARPGAADQPADMPQLCPAHLGAPLMRAGSNFCLRVTPLPERAPNAVKNYSVSLAMDNMDWPHAFVPAPQTSARVTRAGSTHKTQIASQSDAQHRPRAATRWPRGAPAGRLAFSVSQASGAATCLAPCTAPIAAAALCWRRIACAAGVNARTCHAWVRGWASPTTPARSSYTAGRGHHQHRAAAAVTVRRRRRIKPGQARQPAPSTPPPPSTSTAAWCCPGPPAARAGRPPAAPTRRCQALQAQSHARSDEPAVCRRAVPSQPLPPRPCA